MQRRVPSLAPNQPRTPYANHRCRASDSPSPDSGEGSGGLVLRRFAMIRMANDDTRNLLPRPLKPLTDIGGRAAAATLRPLTGASVPPPRRGSAWSIARWTACSRAASSNGCSRAPACNRSSRKCSGARALTQLIDTFFDSGLFDRLVDRLLSSDGLWRFIDEIAASPAVRAAVSQQGLGFADQVGEAVRARSRKADRRLERAADRLSGSAPHGVAADPDARRRRWAAHSSLLTATHRSGSRL